MKYLMGIKIKSIKLFIVIIIISLPSSYLQAQTVLQIKGELPKTEYIVGERIDLLIVIKNIGYSSIKENLRNSVDIKLYDNNGKTLKYYGHSGGACSPDKNEFKINEEWYSIILLNDCFGKQLTGRSQTLYYEPGEYTIKIIFKPPHLKESTESISFLVNNPKGEESVVLKRFLQICNQQSKSFDFVNDLYSLHVSYPNSVYSPTLLDIIGANYLFSLDDEVKGESIYQELLEKYPWSPLGRGALALTLRKMSSKEERENYINKLLPGSKNYPMHRILEKLLMELKNNTWKE
jgi:hypothetical protein